MSTRELKIAIRESHRKQFEGMDYQQAAYDSLPSRYLLIGGPDITTEELAQIESTPEPGCECGFCNGAQWQ